MNKIPARLRCPEETAKGFYHQILNCSQSQADCEEVLRLLASFAAKELAPHILPKIVRDKSSYKEGK